MAQAAPKKTTGAKVVGKAPEPQTPAPRKARIVKGFDIDALARKRAALSSGRTPTDLVAELSKISPEIAKLKVGETVFIPIPDEYNFINKTDKGNDKELTRRGFLMAIRAKLNHMTPKGGVWEGRTFKSIIADDGEVAIQRGEDGKAVERKTTKGRPRKAADKPADQAPQVTVEGGAIIKEG